MAVATADHVVSREDVIWAFGLWGAETGSRGEGVLVDQSTEAVSAFDAVWFR